MTITREALTALIGEHHHIPHEAIYAVDFDLHGYTVHRWHRDSAGRILMNTERSGPIPETLRYDFPEDDLLGQQMASVFL